MILEEAADRETLVFDFLEGAGLEIREQEVHDALVMDMYIPEVLRGKDADEMGGELILERLKEVDGSGSGLDADTVDGRHAGEFVLKNPGLAGRLALVAVDGGLADGGTFGEFVQSFAAGTPDVFK